MKEEFLHFVWQYQYFSAKNLTTTQGKNIIILEKGTYNNDAGADFSDANIQIGEEKWRGDVEIHLKSSDWHKHGHSANKAYNKVILHVVWEDDSPILYEDNSKIPTLTLKERVSDDILEKYKQFFQNNESIACAKLLADVPRLTIFSMLDRSAIQRLENKAIIAKEILKNNDTNWEETCFQMLAKNFGFSTNSEAFLKLAKQTPFKYFHKQSDSLFQMEALIFGQASFLDEIIENKNNDKKNIESIDNEDDTDVDYQQNLANEYAFLKKKYNLVGLDKNEWKFSQMRPANFPTVRLAQFVAFIQQTPLLFSFFTDTETVKDFLKKFHINVSDYWENHYHFGKKSAKKTASFGKSSTENIIINTIVPMLVLISKELKSPNLMERAIFLMEKIKPEDNNIIRLWADLGIKAQHALDSQALLEQYKSFCQPKKCLLCEIGNKILRL